MKSTSTRKGVMFFSIHPLGCLGLGCVSEHGDANLLFITKPRSTILCSSCLPNGPIELDVCARCYDKTDNRDNAVWLCQIHYNEKVALHS